MSALPPLTRILVITLIVITAASMALLAMYLLGTGPLNPPGTATTVTITSVMLLAGILFSAAMLAGTYRADALGGGLYAVMARNLERVLPLSGLTLVVIAAVAMPGNIRTGESPKFVLLRALVWIAVGVSCMFVLRPPRPPTLGCIDSDRALRVALPGFFFLGIAAVQVVLFGPTAPIARLIAPCLFAAGFIGVVVLPGLFMAGAIKGLQATFRRGERVAQFVDAHPRLLPTAVVAKLAVLGIFWAVWHTFAPDEPKLVFHSSTLTMAAISTLIVLILFALESKIRLPVFDSNVVSRTTSIVFNAGMAAAGTSALLIVAFTNFTPPQAFAAVSVALLVVLGLLFARHRRPRIQVLGYPLLVVAATALSVTLIPLQSSVRPLRSSGIDTRPLRISVAIGLLVIVGALVWILVAALRRRQFGWAVFIGAMLTWTIIIDVWADVVKPISFMTFDLLLTVLLGIAAVTYMLRIQKTIDGYEIIATVVVTSVLIEFGALTDLLPKGLSAYPLILAVAGPGVAVIWKQTANLNDRQSQRRSVQALSFTALLYTQCVAAFAFSYVKPSESLDMLSSAGLGFLSIPLLLLLVAAHNPREARRSDTPA